MLIKLTDSTNLGGTLNKMHERNKIQKVLTNQKYELKTSQSNKI